MNNRTRTDGGESSPGMGCLGLIFLALIVIYLAASSLGAAFYNEHTATCTVSRMDRGGGDNSSRYRIYTNQCGVLVDDDSLLRGKTNSADVWSEISVGHTYRLRIIGYRLGLTSNFPNILAVEREERRG